MLVNTRSKSEQPWGIGIRSPRSLCGYSAQTTEGGGRPFRSPFGRAGARPVLAFESAITQGSGRRRSARLQRPQRKRPGDDFAMMMLPRRRPGMVEQVTFNRAQPSTTRESRRARTRMHSPRIDLRMHRAHKGMTVSAVHGRSTRKTGQVGQAADRNRRRPVQAERMERAKTKARPAGCRRRQTNAGLSRLPPR